MLAKKDMEDYYPCSGKSICAGCIHSLHGSGNDVKCPFCSSARGSKTNEDMIEEIMKRVEANNDTGSMWLAYLYFKGAMGVQQDRTKAKELLLRAAKLGLSKAH